MVSALMTFSAPVFSSYVLAAEVSVPASRVCFSREKYERPWEACDNYRRIVSRLANSRLKFESDCDIAWVGDSPCRPNDVMLDIMVTAVSDR